MLTQPGDLVLTHGHSFVHRAIRWVQAVRFRGSRKPYAYWNHATVIVGEHGEIVEAMARRGVRRANLSIEYLSKSYRIVDVRATAADRAEIVAFTESCLGQEYGYLVIAALLLWTLCGGKLVVGLDGTNICSGLAAQALVRGTANFPRNPSMMMPADLASYYGVRP